MRKDETKIVADGPQRFREAGDYPTVRKRLFAEVARRYESQRKTASLWRRLWIEVAFHREVSAELKKKFPLGSLHVAASSR